MNHAVLSCCDTHDEGVEILLMNGVMGRPEYLCMHSKASCHFSIMNVP